MEIYIFILDNTIDIMFLIDIYIFILRHYISAGISYCIILSQLIFPCHVTNILKIDDKKI